MTLRHGSLFSGYGGLDLAVEATLDVRTVWQCEVDRAASLVLAHRFPGVPNLGDITRVRWSEVEPVEVLSGGSPCQGLSPAGRRAGSGVVPQQAAAAIPWLFAVHFAREEAA